MEIELELFKIDTQQNVVDNITYTEEVTALTFKTKVKGETYQLNLALCDAWTYNDASWNSIGNRISRHIEELKNILEMK